MKEGDANDGFLSECLSVSEDDIALMAHKRAETNYVASCELCPGSSKAGGSTFSEDASDFAKTNGKIPDAPATSEMQNVSDSQNEKLAPAVVTAQSQPGAIRMGGVESESTNLTIDEPSSLKFTVTASLVDESVTFREMEEEIRQTILRQSTSAEVVLKVDDNDQQTATRRIVVMFCLLLVVISAILGGLLPIVLKSTNEESMETLSDEEYLMYLLTPLSGDAVLLNASSAQYQAFHWLVKTDNYFASIQNASRIFVTERYAMAVLYYSTDGPNWIDGMDFLSNSSICSWGGLTCNRNNMTLKIEIDGNNLHGILPSELGALKALFHLTFFNNALHGTLPESVGELSDLEEFDVQNNQLTGPIPNTYADLRRLKNFFVYDNLLTGTIPNGLTKISSLEHIQLWKNLLTGTIPEFAVSAAIRDINFLSNSLEGPIPESLYTLARLENLYLGWNHLTGSISTNLGKLTNLQRAWLNSNRFRGSLPSEIGRLKKVWQLRIFQNGFEGTVPSQVGLMDELQDIALDSNYFTGTIASEIGSLKALKTLIFHNNSIVGNIASEICEIDALESLSADCSSSSGNESELSCPCCTACCDKMTGECRAEVHQYCRNIARKFEAPTHRGTVCECNDDFFSSTYEDCAGERESCPFVSQSCIDNACESCNSDETICGVSQNYGYTFDELGNWLSFRGQFQYTAGLNDLVYFQWSSSDFPQLESFVSINGEKCIGNFASWVCANGLRGWVVECDNVEEGISIDTCVDLESSGPLQFFFQNFDQHGCPSPITPYCYFYRRDCIL